MKLNGVLIARVDFVKYDAYMIFIVAMLNKLKLDISKVMKKKNLLSGFYIISYSNSNSRFD